MTQKIQTILTNREILDSNQLILLDASLFGDLQHRNIMRLIYNCRNLKDLNDISDDLHRLNIHVSEQKSSLIFHPNVYTVRGVKEEIIGWRNPLNHSVTVHSHRLHNSKKHLNDSYDVRGLNLLKGLAKSVNDLSKYLRIWNGSEADLSPLDRKASHTDYELAATAVKFAIFYKESVCILTRDNDISRTLAYSVGSNGSQRGNKKLLEEKLSVFIPTDEYIHFYHKELFN